MIVTVTKAQFQSILSNVSTASLVFYAAAAGYVVSVAIAFPTGWVAFTIPAGTYTQADFDTDMQNFTALHTTTISV